MKKKFLNYTVLIGKDADGIYVAKVPDIAGCYTQGRSVNEVMTRVKEAIKVCVEVEEGK